ncbi:MAG: tetratricopeptide repeat protein [Bacteroidales bacterium]|nr:tetratricopeptide repeat protein [Bacteroidales bacterium]MBK9357164.1 tetratricopeptide repeat protein [Bacteroidales bacterium]
MILISQNLSAQDKATLPDIFSTSYTYETSGEYSKATELLKKVYDESSYEINLRLGWLTYKAGLFSESAAYYNKAIALMPLSIEARLGYVMPASSAGNWDQVVTRYNEILKIDPNHYTVNYRMGLIYYGRKDYQSAFRYLEKIANMYPFDYDALIMLGWTEYQLGKLREAKVLFGKALLNRPGDASALEGISLIK